METVLVTCPGCRKKGLREDMHKVTLSQVRYYCDKCIVTKQDDIEEKREKLLKDGMTTKVRDSMEYAELIDYICSIYNLKMPSKAMLKQIKDFHNKDGLRYQGMELALHYFHEIEGHDVLEGSGVGIIPYVYDEARDFYIQKMENEKAGEQEVKFTQRSFKTRPKSQVRKRIGVDLNEI